VQSEDTTFWLLISLVGRYRRSPIAISPNLSNLQSSVEQITDGIERMHDDWARVDMVAVRLHVSLLLSVPPSLCFDPLHFFPQMSQTAQLCYSRRRRQWMDFEFSCSAFAVPPYITVTTVAWRRDADWMVNSPNCHNRRSQPGNKLYYQFWTITHHISSDLATSLLNYSCFCRTFATVACILWPVDRRHWNISFPILSSFNSTSDSDIIQMI